MLRIPRGLRYAGLLCLTVALITAGAVFGAQTGDGYACVTLADYSSNRMVIYDPSHHRLSPETRYSSSTYWATSGDYYLATQAHPDESRLYKLTLKAIESGDSIVLEEEIYRPSSTGVLPRAAWSSDERLLAYVWQDADQLEHISIFNMEDHSKRTAPLGLDSDITDQFWLMSWSADNAYLSMVNQRDFTVYGWSVEQMRLLRFTADFSMGTIAAWSPAGHQLAAITLSADGELELFLINPDDADRPIRVPRSLSSTFAERVYAIAWSPDSGYVTLVKQRSLRVDDGRSLIRQWYFDIFTDEGTPLEVDIAGVALLPPPPASSPQASFVTAPIAPGFWSREGHWTFLQENFEGSISIIHLMAFDPETREFQTLEEDIVPELYPQMFQRTSAFLYSASQAYIPENERLMIPQWRDGTIALDYIDYETNTRFNLIEGADEVLASAFMFYNQPELFLWNDDVFIIPWRRQTEVNPETRLTIIRRENGQTVTEVTDMEDIEQISWLGPDWVGFVASRDGIRGIETVNVKTGAHYRLLEGFDAENGWYAVISPDERHVALVITPQPTYISSEQGRLYLVSLDSGTSRLIHEDVTPGVLWSPDGDSFAFLHPGAFNRPAVQVVSANGDVLSDTDVPRRISGTMHSIYLWSRCEANPTPNWR